MRLIFRRILALVWRLLLAIFGFIIGLGCSILFYEFSLRETDFDDAYKVLMFLSTAVFLSIGFAFSRQLACMTLLTLPEFVGRAGRRSLQATILILILAGPLKNLGDNGEETVRFLGCIKDMLWDIFMAGVDLVLAPIQHILSDLKKSVSGKQRDKNYNASMIRNVMEPVLEEIEGDSEILKIKEENDRIDGDMGITRRSAQLEQNFALESSEDESERVMKKYKKKVAYRCEEIFTKGTESCIKIFQQKYEDCSESIGVTALAWVICWPMKLEFVCNILGEFSMDSACDEVEGLIDKNFGKTYTLAKKGIDDFTQGFKFKINYLGLSEIINIESIKEKRDALLEQFLESKKYAEWYLTMIKRFLTLSYLFVVFSAINYHNNYFKKLSYDNIYLTGHFQRIERRRKFGERKKSTLLPLKSFEKGEITSVKRIWLTGPERKKFYNQLFAICLQAAIVFTIFALDHIFKELLGLLKNHAEIEIKQEGVHVLAIQVTGEGFLSKLMRSIVKDFSVRKKIDMKHFTKPCLPNPRETPASYSQRVTILFCVLVGNAYFEAHFTRFRHCIADFFYPKRYKKRAVWLYNEMLRRRRRKVAHLKRKVLENADRFRTYMPRNPLQLLAHFFPKRCSCLKRWKIARRKCILCLANGAIYHCPRCGFAYCKECFTDVDLNCLLCIAEQEVRQKQNDVMPTSPRTTMSNNDQHRKRSQQNDSDDSVV